MVLPEEGLIVAASVNANVAQFAPLFNAVFDVADIFLAAKDAF